MAELAELISVNNTSIALFIWCIRKALWLDILRYQLGQGLWMGSAILLLAGLINLFFYNMPISLSLILALLPIVAGIFVAIKKMPTVANAASHADNLFKGKSLMTTAAELLYTNTTAPRDFSPWIIQQAAHKAQLWHEQFTQSTYHKQNQVPWAAMGIALLGFFFILQPGAPVKQQVARADRERLTANSKSGLVASLVDEIRMEENALRNAPLSQDELTEQFSSADKQALPSADTHPQLTKKQAPSDDLSASLNKDTSTTTMADNSQGADAVNNQLQAKNQHADAGIGTQADTTLSSSSRNDTNNMSIKFVDIELQEGTLVSTDGKSMPFKEQQFTGSDERLKLPSTVASRNTSTAYTTRFSLSQQQYVNAYFKNIHVEK